MNISNGWVIQGGSARRNAFENMIRWLQINNTVALVFNGEFWPATFSKGPINIWSNLWLYVEYSIFCIPKMLLMTKSSLWGIYWSLFLYIYLNTADRSGTYEYFAKFLTYFLRWHSTVLSFYLPILMVRKLDVIENL